jgi:TPR repeat protein
MNKVFLIAITFVLFISNVHASCYDKKLEDSANFTSCQEGGEKGLMSDQYNLARMYQFGVGVAPDSKQAVYWYEKAAKQGHVKAQFNLGLMYNKEQNDVQAVEWYRKAAEQGHLNAQFSLGLMYGSGQGVAQDHKQAVEWYRKAAEQGLDRAQYTLGNMYDQGLGVVQDNQQSLEWYNKAAEQGHAKAQYNLGVVYTNGKGVTQDNVIAYMWLVIASSYGDKIALSGKESVATEMTAEQISEAEKLAKEWMAKHQ